VRSAATRVDSSVAADVEVALPRAVRVRVTLHVVGRSTSSGWSFRITDAQGARLRDDLDRWRMITAHADEFTLLLPPGPMTIERLSRTTGPIVRSIVAERDLLLSIEAPPLR